MCALYGLSASDRPGSRVRFEPVLETQDGHSLLEEWVTGEQGGRARITGKRALNLNPIIRADAGGVRSLELAWWWLWADGSGPVGFSAFNSRDDRLLRSWRGPFQQRAIIPAGWYVEKGVRFGLPGDEVFGIAALTSTVIDDRTGEPRISYSMVTRDAVGEAATAWHRMPLVLPHEMHDEWLDPGCPGDERLVSRVRSVSAGISGALTAQDPDPAPNAPRFDPAPTLF